MNQRRTIAIFALLVCISGLLLLGNLTRGQDWGGDFAAYIMQAKSITEFAPAKFVESNRFTVQQSCGLIGPTAYPWGFPLLLAPLYGLFGLAPVALKSVNVISWLLFLFVLWFGFRGSHPTSWFLLLTALFALNPTLLAFSNNILSDLPFLLVSTFCLSLIQKVFAQDRRVISHALDPLLIGVGIAFAFLIRTTGVLILLTLAFSQVISYLQRESHKMHRHTTGERCGLLAKTFRSITGSSLKSQYLPLLPYVVFLVSVAISNWAIPDGGGPSYVSYLKGISIGIIKRNLEYYLSLPSDFFSTAPDPDVIYGATIPLAIAGAIRRYRSDYPAIVYVALTVLLYVIWPYRQGLRFLFPILPFYLSFTLSGLEGFCGGTKPLERAFRKVVCYVSILLVICCFGVASIRAAYRNISQSREVTYGPFAPTSQEMFSFIASHTEGDSVIVFFKPRVMRLMTGRQAVMINRVDQLGCGDYLCLYLKPDAYAQVSHAEVERLLAQRAAWIVYENDDFKVYRLDKMWDHTHNRGPGN